RADPQHLDFFPTRRSSDLHIGRELHDNVGQLLSLAKLNFGSIKPEKQTEGKEILAQAIQEVRGLSKQLNLDWVESISINEFIERSEEHTSELQSRENLVCC